MKARDYQRKAEDSVFEAWDEAPSTVVVMPTGTGKTVLFANVIRRSFPRRAMVLAHREELIFQAVDKIQKITGFNAGVEMAKYRTMPGSVPQADADEPFDAPAILALCTELWPHRRPQLEKASLTTVLLQLSQAGELNRDPSSRPAKYTRTSKLVTPDRSALSLEVET